ncbi:MAG: circularly permuted type 2 ATP-grasp protein [Gammaproteobacteria bacterium]|nr:circularly permuted type 2 ATP-grasp protein [Gammaproteobacteria bacterium]
MTQDLSDNAISGSPVTGYRPPAGVYDELMQGDALRPHWGFLAGHLRPGSDGWARNLNHTVAQLLEESAVTDLAEGKRRPWRLDALPYVLDPNDWQLLERGLTQRARLLNATVADLYGAQSMLKSSMPPALAFANPDFLLPSCGYAAPDDVYLHLLAFDLGRSPDGQWRVLANRTEAPSGLGYTLENRLIMARCVPELFDQGSIARVAHFFRAYGDNLQHLGEQSGAASGLSVILSGGPDQPTYFEHTFLGRYLGHPVVEGADLTVRDGKVFLKTLEGLKPISLIARHIESVDCDPLELRVRSMHGAPGLLRAAANGSVTIANAIGSGVVENDAFMSFLPGLCESLLGETLELPSLATWWCGQDSELEHVRNNMDSLVLRQAFKRKPLLASSVDAFMAGDLDAGEALSLAQAFTTAPYNLVGRESIKLSTVPYWRADNESGDGEWAAAPMTLRLYVAATQSGYRLLPGGLARLATPAGDISKDVWVPAQQGELGATIPETSLTTRRSDRDLPSRTGDDLFWLGRYLERTEGAVRLYRGLFSYAGGEGAVGGPPVELDLLTRLLVAMDYLSPQRARRAAAQGRAAVEQELWHILFDPESDDGLAKVLANVHRTADHVRERLSRDVWRLFERLSEVPELRWRVHSVADVVRLLDDLIEKLSAINGQIYENMTRGYGWRLLDMGRRLERCTYVVRVVRDLCTREPQHLGALDLMLDVCDSTITHRARYQANPTLSTALDLLLTDNSNPRSVIYQIEKLQAHMATMPLEQNDGALSESARILLAAHSDLALTDIDKLVEVISKQGLRTHLNRLLKRLEKSMGSLHEVVTRTYFDHTISHRR